MLTNHLEALSEKAVNFFDCRAFSLFKNVLGHLATALNLKESHCRLFVTFPLCNVKLKNDIWLDKSPTAKLARKRSQKWNGSCDWLILGKECCSDVSSRFFGGSVAWHPKKRLRRRLRQFGSQHYSFNRSLSLNMKRSSHCNVLDFAPRAMLYVLPFLRLSKRWQHGKLLTQQVHFIQNWTR